MRTLNLSHTSEEAANAPGVLVAGETGSRRLGRWVFVAGLLLILVGGALWYRAANPPLSDREQIARRLEELRLSTERRDAGPLLDMLDEKFAWNGMDRQEMKSNLAAAFLQWRDIQVLLADVRITTSSNEATTTGEYRLSFRPGPKADVENAAGRFTLKWHRRNGNWQIVTVEGGEELLSAG